MSKPRRDCDIFLGFANYAQTRGGLKTLLGELSLMVSISRAAKRSTPAHHLLPGTTQRPLNAPNRGQQDVDAPGFDFLDGPGVEVNHFGQPLLGDVSPHSLPAHVRPKAFQLLSLLRIDWHALLRRILALTNTAQWGVIGSIKRMSKHVPNTARCAFMAAAWPVCLTGHRDSIQFHAHSNSIALAPSKPVMRLPCQAFHSLIVLLAAGGGIVGASVAASHLY